MLNAPYILTNYKNRPKHQRRSWRYQTPDHPSHRHRRRRIFRTSVLRTRRPPFSDSWTWPSSASPSFEAVACRLPFAVFWAFGPFASLASVQPIWLKKMALFCNPPPTPCLPLWHSFAASLGGLPPLGGGLTHVAFVTLPALAGVQISRPPGFSYVARFCFLR